MSHTIKVRIYYEDTDAGGIVYHANYLRYAERGRTEYLAHLGIPHKEVIGMAVSQAALRFIRPATLGDELTVVTEPVAVKGASCDLLQNIYKDDVLLVEIKITVVSVANIDGEIKPVRMPGALREAMEKDLKQNA